MSVRLVNPFKGDGTDELFGRHCVDVATAGHVATQNRRITWCPPTNFLPQMNWIVTSSSPPPVSEPWQPRCQAECD